MSCRHPMGTQRKRKWVAEEEEALLAGIAKLGVGKWKVILRDPEFAPLLANRSNIDLKDKWRNIQEGLKDRPQLPQAEALPAPRSSAAPATRAPGALPDDAAADGARDDPSNGLHDSRNPFRYDELIFEALSTINGSDGADVGAIFSYIEKREEELPPNFRRKLGLRLGKLSSQGKLEKVGKKNYRIIRDTSTSEAEPTTPTQNDVRTRPIQAPTALPSYEAIQEAAMAAAYIIAEAEYKSFLACEAVEESERVSKMADDTEAVLQMILMQYCS